MENKSIMQQHVYLVFPSNGGTATEHHVHRAAVEESGVLALYATDEAGNDTLIHAFNKNVWQEVKRMHAVKNA